MNIPKELKYTEEHEWIRIDGSTATIGITDFAQGELGDIVYIDIDSIGNDLDGNEIFGTVEAVKTVSDLILLNPSTSKAFKASNLTLNFSCAKSKSFFSNISTLSFNSIINLWAVLSPIPFIDLIVFKSSDISAS